MCEPALAALQTLFPQAEISLLVRPLIAELLHGHPAIRHMIQYEHRTRHAGLSGKWTLARELSGKRFDLAILFQNAFEAAALAFLAGIPARYGYATDARAWLLTHPISVPTKNRGLHQVQYFLQMLSSLNGPVPERAPRLYVTEAETQGAPRTLAGFGIDPAAVLIGVNPGSTYGGAKRWYPERFAAAVDAAVSELGLPNVQVAVVGAPGEESLGQAIAGHVQTSVVVLSGRTTVRELMMVVQRCAAFVTNDTGPMHVASALGVPVISIFGPTDWRATAPFGPGHTLIRHEVDCSPCLLRECPIDHRCMTSVTAEDVAVPLVSTLRATVGFLQGEGSMSGDVTGISKPDLNGVTVFLDRDGTINRDTGYVKAPQELELLPGAATAIARLKQAGARVVVVTNQSGIARGYFTMEGLTAIHAQLRSLLMAEGTGVDAIYFCPHHPDHGCLCRKPGTLMIDRARKELHLPSDQYYMVGDQVRDIELAQRIQARSVLVLTGPDGTQVQATLAERGLVPDRIAPGLSEAVEWILDDVVARAHGASTRVSVEQDEPRGTL
jgi:heptosyltransferase-2